MSYDFNKFGSRLFDDKLMKKRLPDLVYQQFLQAKNQELPLEVETAEVIAEVMKDWALENGCTHFAHWFHPLTGSTAEKHNSFIEERDGLPITKFSGKALIKDEPDASSLPSGGLRATFEARGYTYWDLTSPAFIRGHVLYIPTVFISFTGESLDTKGPLIKSIDAISNACTRLVNIFGDKQVKRVIPCVGLEQEFFLVDRKDFIKRRDLFLTGKTVFGTLPPKTQELDKHYFGSIPERVNDFMEEVNKELWDLGVFVKNEHNEAAPAQFEMSPTYRDCNVSIDQNMLMMDVLQRVAIKHDLACLLHEKPFAKVNGSGKHNNYSLFTDTGDNLFDPGKDPHSNVRFLLMVAALIKTVDKYADIIRLASSGPGNDYRLGANEAPPAIISMYLGDTIENIITNIVSERPSSFVKSSLKEFGMNTIKNLPRDNSDRNRTSPIAFTGNKFEFRTLGSSLNASLLNIVINTGLASSVDEICAELEDSKHRQDVREKAFEIIADIYKKHNRILFSGNGYANEWLLEAKKRGLNNIPTYFEAIKEFNTKESINLFNKYNIFSELEIVSRTNIMYESYINVRTIEAKTLASIVYQNIIPSAIKELNFITTSPKEFLPNSILKKVDKLKDFIDICSAQVGLVEDELDVSYSKTDIIEKGEYILTKVIPACEKLRETTDLLEHYISKENLPYPTYEELFFGLDY